MFSTWHKWGFFLWTYTAIVGHFGLYGIRDVHLFVKGSTAYNTFRNVITSYKSAMWTDNTTVFKCIGWKATDFSEMKWTELYFSLVGLLPYVQVYNTFRDDVITSYKICNVPYVLHIIVIRPAVWTDNT